MLRSAATYGWRYGMLVPGAMGVAMGLMLIAFIRNSPELLNLPPADIPQRNSKPSADAKAVQGGA